MMKKNNQTRLYLIKKSIILTIITSLTKSKTVTLECIPKQIKGNQIIRLEMNHSEPFVVAQAIDEFCSSIYLSQLYTGTINIYPKQKNISSKFIGMSHYVNYTKKIKKNFQYKMYDNENHGVQGQWESVDEYIRPLLSIIQVETDGVFFKKFNETWGKAVKTAEDKPQFEEIFTPTNLTGAITAFYHFDGTKRLIIGLESLKIGIINLATNIEGGDQEKGLELLIDASSQDKEEGQGFNFITGIPGTDKVIVAPTRVEMLKIDYVTGDKESFSNPIDMIQHLEIPFSWNRRTKKHTMPNTKFIATSKNNNINFVGDYSTMKPIRFFTLRSPRYFIDSTVNITGLETDRVDTIEFYGYYPKSQHYLMANKELPYVYLYTTIYDKFDDFEELIPNIQTLRWIEDLSYVFYSNRGTNCGFWIVQQYGAEQERKIELCKDRYMATVDYKMIKITQESVQGNKFVNIPLIKFTENSLMVGWELGGTLKVPLLLWPHCLEIPWTTRQSRMYSMNFAIYSGFFFCTEYRVGVREQFIILPEILRDKFGGVLPHLDSFGFREFKVEPKLSWIKEVEANKDKKILHQISLCTVCGNPNEKDIYLIWFPSGVFMDDNSVNENIINSTRSFGEGVEIFIPARIPEEVKTVLALVKPFPELEYTDKGDNKKKIFYEGGCATGFTPNDLGICQNCPSYIQDYMSFYKDFVIPEEDSRFESVRKIFECSNCYTHRIPNSKLNRQLLEIMNFNVNTLFCLDFNPFGHSHTETRYQTVKASKFLEIYSLPLFEENSIFSDWVNTKFFAQRKSLFLYPANIGEQKLMEFHNYISIKTNFFGTTFFSQEQPRIQDCFRISNTFLFLQLKSIKQNTNSNQFLTIPGYKLSLKDGSKKLGTAYLEFIEKFESKISNEAGFSEKFYQGDEDFDYAEFREMRNKILYSEDKEFNYECLAECGLGYYTNKTTMSCLRCRYGCAFCKEYKVCDKCIPGFRIIEGACYQGCPEGHYSQSFVGVCKKCLEGCQICRDDLRTKEEVGDEFQGRCTQCMDKNDFIEAKTGKCLKKCDTGGYVDEDNFGRKYCVECKDGNCEKCSFNNIGDCLVCKEGYEINLDRNCEEEEISSFTILFEEEEKEEEEERLHHAMGKEKEDMKVLEEVPSFDNAFEKMNMYSKVKGKRMNQGREKKLS